MYSLKLILKKSKSLRSIHKNIKYTFWEYTDSIRLNYFKFKGDKVIMSHYARSKNFGDNFNNDLLSYFGYKLHYAKTWKDSQVVLTGSILQHYHPNFKGYVLGAGFIKSHTKRNNVFWKVKLIRGPLSAKQCFKNDKNITYGDPGLLASKIFKKSAVINYKLGIVPHHVDYFIVKNYFKDYDNIKIINVTKTPGAVAKEITGCENIVSSSLHGLIFADSYGIPNIHVKFSDKLLGGLHKFEDYYLSFGSKHEYIEYKDNIRPKTLIENCKTRISQDQLCHKKQEIEKILSDILKKTYNN